MSDAYRDYRNPGRQSVVQVAQQKLGTPGLLLVIIGAIGFAQAVVKIAMIVTWPTITHDLGVDMIKGNTPPGPDQQRAIDYLNENQGQFRLDGPVNVAFTLVEALITLLTLVGGLKMRAIKGYGLAVTGALCASLPINGCCCVALPIGIWALFVLGDGEVKAGFVANRVPSQDTDRDV
jgi:hypothetical protein